MFIKIWELIIFYIDRMDWRAGHLTTTEGTGDGAFANKNCPQGRAFEQSNARGMPGGGMLAAGIDSHIMTILTAQRLRTSYIASLVLSATNFTFEKLVAN